MPMIDELLTKLNQTPPDTEEELRAMLDETGYDLVMKQPGGEGEDRGYMEEEAEEEVPEMGESDEAEEGEPEGLPEGIGELMGGLMGGGPPKSKLDTSPGGLSAMRFKVSEGILKKPKKGAKR